MSKWSKSKTIDQTPSFTQDFDSDFDEVTKAMRKDYIGENYAFMRFGDGEFALMMGRNHKAKSDKWQSSEVHQMWNEYLWEAIRCKQEYAAIGSKTTDVIRYGISSEGHHGAETHQKLMYWIKGAAKIPDSHITYAEIFCFANYERTKEWDLSKYRVVHQNAEDDRYRVPSTAVVQHWAVDSFVKGLVHDKDTRPILVSAGPVSKAIIWEFTRKSKGPLPASIIDVGSAIDPITRGRPTRRFHRGVDTDWKPQWEIGSESDGYESDGTMPEWGTDDAESQTFESTDESSESDGSGD